MDNNAIKHLIESNLPNCQAFIEGDGHHFDAIVVGEVFADKNKVQQQQIVLAILQQAIAQGEIHAINVVAYTPEQWANQS